MSPKIVLYPPPSFFDETNYAGGPAYLRSIARSDWAADVYVFPSPDDPDVPANFKRSALPPHASVSENKGSARHFRQVLVCLAPVWLKLIVGYSKDTLGLARYLKKVVYASRVIHVNGVGCEVVAIAARLAGFKTVIGTVHNLPGESCEARHWVRRGLEKLSFRCCNHFIFPSHYCLERWQARVRVPTSHGVIYHGCRKGIADYKGDRAAALKQLGVSEGIDDRVLVLGIAGRLERCKAHDILLEALSEVKETEGGGRRTEVGGRRAEDGGQRAEDGGQRADGGGRRTDGGGRMAEDGGRRAEDGGRRAEDGGEETEDGERCNQQKLILLVAGDGPLEGALKAMVCELGIEDQVLFLGRCDDMSAFYRTLDVNILPSRSEGLGYSVVEGMHAGLPQIVSDAGGMTELVWNAGGGIVFPSEDADALAAAIVEMRDAGFRQECGQKAQEYAREWLTEERMHAETLGFYERVIGGRRAEGGWREN